MTVVWSHRGRTLRGHERDNTVASFSQASDVGVAGIELDVWRAQNGSWVVDHDGIVRGRPIGAVPADKIPEWMPGLWEAVQSCRVRAINVELKVPEPCDPVLERSLGAALRDHLLGPGAAWRDGLIISSFSRAAVDELAGEFRTGLLVMEEVPSSVARSLREAGYWGVHAEHQLISEETVNVCRDSGLSLVAWTVNDDAAIRRMLDLGVDVIISDVPERVLLLLGRGGVP